MMHSVFLWGNVIDPSLLPRVYTDVGAIPYVLSGANVMCPGLTSPGASMDTELEANEPVVMSSIIMNLLEELL